ncbi:MAG: hypothetical protein LBU79_09235 [Planctomycetota bacterium]|nr:hypothetical protein [Planctomycetota bacterium]
MLFNPNLTPRREDKVLLGDFSGSGGSVVAHNVLRRFVSERFKRGGNPGDVLG